MMINMLPKALAGVPTLQAVRLEGHIAIDGRLDEPAWQSAVVATPFLDHETNKPVSQQTAVRVLYDDNALYVGFECQESRMDILSSTVTQQGGPVFLDDSIEIFLAPYPFASHDNYYHLSANVDGVQYSSHNALTDWDSYGWQAQTSRGEDAWFAEIRIPFEILSARGHGAPYWRVNFARNEIPRHQTSSWAFVGPKFHTPSKFGGLLGISVPSRNIGSAGHLEPMKSSVAQASPIEMPRFFDYNAACAI